MNRLLLIVLVSAMFFTPSVVWADCKPGETLETIAGKLEYNLEDVEFVLTPYSLVTQDINYVLTPDGPFVGMEWGAPGFEKNAEAKLSSFVGQQVRVTGCTSVDSTGKYHDIGRIMNIEMA